MVTNICSFSAGPGLILENGLFSMKDHFSVITIFLLIVFENSFSMSRTAHSPLRAFYENSIAISNDTFPHFPFTMHAYCLLPTFYMCAHCSSMWSIRFSECMFLIQNLCIDDSNSNTLNFCSSPILEKSANRWEKKERFIICQMLQFSHILIHIAKMISSRRPIPMANIRW